LSARAALFALALFALPAHAAERIPALNFSELKAGDPLPTDWRLVTSRGIPRHTRYTLVSDRSVTVLRAESEGSMSSLARRLDVDPARHPWLRWRWKVENLLEKSDMYTKAGDDFPARLYVFFDFDIGRLTFAERLKIRIARMLYGEEVPAAALCYVWASRHPAGASVWNAYASRVRMIVAQSGPEALGQWVQIERNVVQDYRAAFGEAPGRVTGVAVASDTDNTGERALAFYGDAEFLAAPGSE
jgi:hypothetical protein